jgi:hypothetical protein
MTTTSADANEMSDANPPCAHVDSETDGGQMTRRNRSATQVETSRAPITSPGTPRVDGLEQRVLAFAEQLGRIAATVQATTAGWMDGDALKKDLARVRDGATDLLQQLTADAQPVGVSTRTGGSPRRTRGRSGGIVDAPGKKHRRPMPSDPGANRADSQAAKMRAAKTMVKTSRRRGRG